MVVTPEANAIQKEMRDGHDICMMFASCLFAKHVKRCVSPDADLLLDADYCEYWMRRIHEKTGLSYDYVVPALSGAWHVALGLGVGEAEFRCRNQRHKVHLPKYGGSHVQEHSRVLKEACLALLLEFEKGKLQIDKDEVLAWEETIRESLHLDADQSAMVADIVAEIYEEAVHLCLEHMKAERSAAKAKPIEPVVTSAQHVDSDAEAAVGLNGAGDPHAARVRMSRAHVSR